MPKKNKTVKTKEASQLLTLRSENWPTFKCIVYDLDGTLFFSKTLGTACSELAAKCFSNQERIPLEKARSLLRSTRSTLSEKAGFKVSLSATISYLGVDFALWSNWQSKIDLNEHVKSDELIQANVAAVRKKFLVIVLTNITSSLATRTMKFLGLDNHVVELLTSNKNNFIKPSREIYNTLSQRYRLSASDVLSVGDRFHVDLAPALAFGACGYLVKEKKDLIRLGEKLLGNH